MQRFDWSNIFLVFLVAGFFYVIGYASRTPTPSKEVFNNASFIDKPGQAIKWVGTDDREHCVWINGAGKGVHEVFLKKDDPDGLKPLSEEEFKRLQDEMRKRRSGG